MLALQNARNSAVNTACANNLRQIEIANATFATDNNGQYPEGLANDKWSFGHIEDDRGATPRENRGQAVQSRLYGCVACSLMVRVGP